MPDYTKDIDYNAALVEKYGKKRFVTQSNEPRRTDPKAIGWKQGFRAGKDVTEPARAFAKKLLSELK